MTYATFLFIFFVILTSKNRIYATTLCYVLYYVHMQILCMGERRGYDILWHLCSFRELIQWFPILNIVIIYCHLLHNIKYKMHKFVLNYIRCRSRVLVTGGFCVVLTIFAICDKNEQTLNCTIWFLNLETGNQEIFMDRIWQVFGPSVCFKKEIFILFLNTK